MAEYAYVHDPSADSANWDSHVMRRSDSASPWTIYLTTSTSTVAERLVALLNADEES
jgi:hypothetical protein